MKLNVWRHPEGDWGASASIGRTLIFADGPTRREASWEACRRAFQVWRLKQ